MFFLSRIFFYMRKRALILHQALHALGVSKQGMIDKGDAARTCADIS